MYRNNFIITKKQLNKVFACYSEFVIQLSPKVDIDQLWT